MYPNDVDDSCSDVNDSCPTNHTPVNDSCPTNHTPVNDSCPTNHTPVNDSCPTNHTPVNDSCPTNHTPVNDSCPTNHTPVNDSCPTNHTPVDDSCPTNHTPVDDSCPTNHTPVNDSCPTNHTPVNDSRPTNHTPVNDSCPTNHTPVNDLRPTNHTPVDDSCPTNPIDSSPTNLVTAFPRKSFMAMGEIYFWTATINAWRYVMAADEYKDVVLNSLRHLSQAGKVDVFAYVIMPNHIHLIWRINEPNGKESPQGSLLKFTAHTFRKMLLHQSPNELRPYAVAAPNKRHEFWQRDSLAFHLFTRRMAMQKLHYIHRNPLSKHWRLSPTPADYAYSSASFYERGERRVDFLKDLRDEFG